MSVSHTCVVPFKEQNCNAFRAVLLPPLASRQLLLPMPGACLRLQCRPPLLCLNLFIFGLSSVRAQTFALFHSESFCMFISAPVCFIFSSWLFIFSSCLFYSSSSCMLPFPELLSVSFSALLSVSFSQLCLFRFQSFCLFHFQSSCLAAIRRWLQLFCGST